jgi:tripartite-type tricarboxylate transporter receptor subunit TctC
MTTSIPRRIALVLGIAALLAGNAAQAQAPLRVILPVSAGSGVDGIMRAAQNELSKALGGQPVVIENIPGAGGMIGTTALVKAAPDGNTIGVLSNNHAVNPSVFKKVPYDSVNDITPISVVGSTPFVLVANAKVPAKNAKELQALLKAKPSDYNYASAGNGTIIHLAGEMAFDAMGVQITHVPYKGSGPQISDLIGGQVQLGVVPVPAVQAHIKSGSLRAIGVTGKSRVPTLPDVPTMAEQGFPDVDVAGRFMVAGPKGLPADKVKRLHDAFVTAFNTAEVKAAMVKQDNVIAPTTPQAALAFLKSEQERYAQLVKKADIKPE